MYHVFDRCLVAVPCCRTECIRFPTEILLLYHVAGQNVRVSDKYLTSVSCFRRTECIVFDRCLVAVSCCRTECIRFPTEILLLYHVAGQNVTGT
jgi:hypothetical protein